MTRRPPSLIELAGTRFVGALALFVSGASYAIAQVLL